MTTQKKEAAQASRQGIQELSWLQSVKDRPEEFKDAIAHLVFWSLKALDSLDEDMKKYYDCMHCLYHLVMEAGEEVEQ